MTHVGFVAAETFVEDVVFPELFLHLVEIAGDEGHVVHIGEGLLEMLWGESTSGRVREGRGERKRRREGGTKAKKGGDEHALGREAGWSHAGPTPFLFLPPSLLPSLPHQCDGPSGAGVSPGIET